MGQATSTGRFNLENSPWTSAKGQAASLIVRSPSEDKYFQGLAWYSYAEFGGTHVEQHLLSDVLLKHYKTYSAIPNNSTIIVVGKWSPCRRCTLDEENSKDFGGESLINRFIRVSRIFERGIQLKFRFSEFYTQANFEKHGWTTPSTSLFWKDDDAAKSAYQALVNRYKIHSVKDVALLTENDKTYLAQKLRTNLVLMEDNRMKSSVVVIEAVN